MKTMTLCGALAVGLAASTGSAQSVHELLGMNVPAAQAPPTPADTGHASAEEAPFYIAWTVNPVIAGTINTKPVANNGSTLALSGGKIRFALGVGTDITFGWRIPDTYFFLQVSAGFTWNDVSEFSADAPPENGAFPGQLFGGSGDLYQIPIIFTPGFEFELPGGWPFMHGGLIRFGPSIGTVYQDLSVNNITQTINGVVREQQASFGADNWLLAYGGYVDLEFFLSHNISLVMGCQFMATNGADYGDLQVVPTQGGQAFVEDNVSTNSTYTTIVKCGLSFYF
ncbi:MAG: hypothetical protein VX641_03965 [Planctomycetota bacterium]|nr:hypothetical protein [Planctomycetota bacterium]